LELNQADIKTNELYRIAQKSRSSATMNKTDATVQYRKAASVSFITKFSFLQFRVYVPVMSKITSKRGRRPTNQQWATVQNWHSYCQIRGFTTEVALTGRNTTDANRQQTTTDVSDRYYSAPYTMCRRSSNKPLFS